MPTHPLNEAFKTVATWHLPHSPDKTLVGGLNYSPRWTEVDLHGTFQPLAGVIDAAANAISYPVIYGTTREGELATIHYAQRNHMKMNAGSGGFQQHETVVSRRLYLGAHVLPDQAYPSMHFRLPGLQIWFDRPPIEEAVRDNAEKTERTWSYQISLRQLETIRIEAIQAQLKIQYSLNSNLRFSGLDAAVTAWVHIVPDGPQTLQWYLDQESKLETMLAFLAGTPMSSDCIETSGNELGRVVSVMPRQNNVSYCTYQMPHEFFITRPTLAVHFCDIVNKWFDAHARVEMPSQVALSVMASEQSWLNIEFLSLMQVLEGFHRGLLGGVYTPPDHYAIVEAALTDAIPPEVAEDHRTALRSRIKYGNEVSLSRRIRELLKRLSVEIRQQILGRDGTMSQRWIDTRNYYTHWDEGLRPNVFGSQELFHANLRLRHFVRALFLDLMGVSQEAILEGLSGGHRESQHLMQINSAERNRQASNASPDDLGQSS